MYMDGAAFIKIICQIATREHSWLRGKVHTITILCYACSLFHELLFGNHVAFIGLLNKAVLYLVAYVICCIYVTVLSPQEHVWLNKQYKTHTE